MRIAVVWSLAFLGLGCGAGPRLPPEVALMARYPVATQGVPGGAALKRIAVVQDDVNGPRIDRAVADALRRTGRQVVLLPPGTTGVAIASRAVGADAVVHLSLKVKREQRGRGARRTTVLRRKSGFTTYITPPTPVGVPLDTLYPQQAEEQTPVEFPVDVHFIDALVDVRVQRVSDGRVIAAWRQELGAYRVARPAPAPAAAGPSSQPVEQVAHAWTAVVGDAGADLARWIEAPQVEVTRPLWLMRVGPPSAVAATRRAIDLADHGDWRAAEAAFREALAAAPRDPRSHANLAVALERRGDRAGAWAELKAAVALERPGEVRCANVLHEFTRTFLPAAPPEVLLRQSTSAPSRAPAIAPSP